MLSPAYLSVVDENLEEGVHEQDPVRQDAATVQQHRLNTNTIRTTNPYQPVHQSNMDETKTTVWKILEKSKKV